MLNLSPKQNESIEETTFLNERLEHAQLRFSLLKRTYGLVQSLLEESHNLSKRTVSEMVANRRNNNK